MARNEFGLEDADETPDFDTLFADEDPAPPASPAGEAAPTPGSAPAEEATPAPPADSPPPPPTGVPLTEAEAGGTQVEEPEPPKVETPAEPPKKFAGRYDTPEDLEKGYKELQADYTRKRQEDLLRQQQEDQRLQRLEQQLQQQNAILAQVRFETADPETQDALRQQAALNQQVEAVVAQRLGPMQAQQQAQAQVQQENYEASVAISEFARKHPELVPNSEQDLLLRQVVDQVGVNTANVEALDAAYEAVQNPALRQVLLANPHLIETDDGMTYARQQAQLLSQSPSPG